MIGNKKPHPTASPDPSERRGEAPPNLPERGGVPMRTRGIMTQGSFSDNFCKILANLSPLLSEGSGEAVGAGGGFCISLCKTDSYKGICGTCYSSTPKNDCFLNKVAYLCKQRTESPPDLPEPTVTDRREVMGEERRSQDKPQDV